LRGRAMKGISKAEAKTLVNVLSQMLNNLKNEA
jgi:hydrogenase maturation factor